MAITGEKFFLVRRRSFESGKEPAAMTMKIGDEGSLPSLTTEQIEGKAAVAKGDASAEGVVIDAAEPGSTEGAGGALSFTETMPEPDHSAVRRAVDAARQYAGVKRTIKHDIHKAERDVSREVDKGERKARRTERQAKDALWEAESQIEGDVRGAEREIDRKARRAERQIKDKIWETGYTVKKVIDDKTQSIEKKVADKLRPIERKLAFARDLAHLSREAYDIDQMLQVADNLCWAYELAEMNGDGDVNIRISDTGKCYSDGNTVYITPQQAAMLHKKGVDLGSEVPTDDVPSMVSSIGDAISSSGTLGALTEDAIVTEQLAAAARSIEEAAAQSDGTVNFEQGYSDMKSYASGGDVYLTPEQYIMLQNRGFDVTPGSSMSTSNAETMAGEISEDIASAASGVTLRSLAEKVDWRSVGGNAVLADRLIHRWVAHEEGGTLPVGYLPVSNMTSGQVNDAVLSFGSTCVSASAKDGNLGDWPGAVAVARPSAEQLGEAFSTAQQEVASDLTSKASAGEEGSVDVPQSTV